MAPKRVFVELFKSVVFFSIHDILYISKIIKGGGGGLPNIPTDINNIVDEFVKNVRELLENRVKKIILYGSYARGDYNNSSDIDIMILTDFNDDELIENRRKSWDLAYDFEEKYNFDIELNPVVKNIDNFNYWVEGLPFYMNVQREGIVLSES